jgi:hypothetical protein
LGEGEGEVKKIDNTTRVVHQYQSRGQTSNRDIDRKVEQESHGDANEGAGSKHNVWGIAHWQGSFKLLQNVVVLQKSVLPPKDRYQFGRRVC